MEIRFDGLSNVGGLRTVNGARFGMVRNGGTKPHQGVDLYAKVGTPVFAVASGEIVRIRQKHMSYGQDILLRFLPDKQLATRLGLPTDTPLYVLYAHLSAIKAVLGKVAKGDPIGATGISGNADQRYPHLHFEIRTKIEAGFGLQNRINPELIFTGIDYSKPVEAISTYNRTA
jgi:murein DD-endopeptidase MepM/ murein hydrolase activator NlpD